MRRLAVVAAFVVVLIAFAQLGPGSPPGAASPEPRRQVAQVRERTTRLDVARASVPLPRAPVAEVPRTVPTRVSRSDAPGRSITAGDGVWRALANCESGGDASARSAGGRYTGAFQFSDATWQSLGYSGSAADHPYAVQLTAARRLQSRAGWGQWPRCARRLGLR